MIPVLLLALLGPSDKLPEGRGKAELIKACSSCHAAEAVIGNRNSRKGWTELVDEMIFKGAPATARQRRLIIDYLAKEFPLSR
jgi:hypothetical protein